MSDAKTLILVGGVLVLLGIAWTVVQVLARRSSSGLDTAVIQTFRRRVRAWTLLFAVLAAAILFGKNATVIFFGLISFWALREFITLTPTRPGDHRTLFWVFFLCTPVQFVLVAMGKYWLYGILIPVYAFLLIPARNAIAGDPKRFLERTAKIQSGLLICVYCLSYAPALMTLSLSKNSSPSLTAEATDPVKQLPENSSSDRIDDSRITPESQEAGERARLLFFFVLLVQLSDALQYAWAQLPSRHVIAPAINPNKTWEGLLGGTTSAALIGAALFWATPFPYWLAALMSAVISLMGFAGSLTMSAIKRDRGVEDYGTLVEGHGGVLDRIDSMCFAAPVFFHFTCYYLGRIPPIG